MRIRTFVAGAAFLAAAMGFAGAHAGGQVCYDAEANVAGNQVVSQAGCQDIPDAPALPDLPAPPSVP